jgi:uridine kinase
VRVLPALDRQVALERLAGQIGALPRPARVAVDGVDAAGKTTLANELAERVEGAARLSADDYLRPPEERYRQGRESPRGFYDDSFDHERLRTAVLAERSLAIVDGIFLFRRDLNDIWTFRIFVHVELEEAIRRGVERDGSETEVLYRRRYAPGQRLYLEAVRPARLADVIFDNADPARPVLNLGVPGSRSS